MRVATILKTFLPVNTGVDIKTISGLIVLVYLAGGLATDRKGSAIITTTGRELKLINVTQNLKRGGIK